MNRAFFPVAMMVLSIVAGCEKQVPKASPTDEANSGSVNATIPTPPKPPYTEKEWRRDFLSSFNASKQKSDGDGVSTYSACFEPIGDKCNLSMSGKRDGFRKVDHLTPVMTAWQEFQVKYPNKGRTAAFVDLRVVARQCGEAVVVLNPTLNARKWLFMNRIGFMAEGDVVYEQEAPPQGVKRDVDDDRVWEGWSFKLEREDYTKLNQFALAKEKVIRLSGEKGYFTLEKGAVEVFAKDIQEAVKVANIVNESLGKGGGPACSSL